ncbi:MAG: CPBP family intramembrane glutamic endopeptidase [Sphingomonas sp.]
MIIWLLFAVALIAVARIVRDDGKSYARFKTLTETRDRQRAMLRWTGVAFLSWLVIPLAGLALLGRVEALWNFPQEFELGDAAREWIEFGSLYAAALVLGAVLGVLIRWHVLKRPPRVLPRAASRVPDIVPMMPRNAAEARCVALLTLNAGVSEEVFFRLYLPLLIVLAGGGALLAFVAAGLLFGLLHRYQGWAGVIGTTVLGVVFTLAYLLSLGLAVPILLHLALNATNLLVRPALRGWRAPEDKA